MSRKKRGRPKAKKQVTYDSKETKTIIGLLALIVAVVAVFSYFIEGGIFSFVHSLVGDATIFLAIFSTSFAMFMFGSNFPLATSRSVLGQLLFTIFYATFLSSLFSSGADVSEIDSGGIIGSFLYKIMVENVFLNFTPIFIVLVLVVSIPLALSMTIMQFLEKTGAGFNWLYLKFSLGKSKTKEIIDNNLQEVPVISPSTFGDFQKNKIVENSSKNLKNDSKEEAPSVSSLDKGSTSSDLAKSTTKINATEVSNEGAFVNEELQYPEWKLPPISLLNPYTRKKQRHEDIRNNADIIEQTLNSFGVKAKVVDVLVGPTVTQYALDIALGTKVSKISNLSNDLALALATSSNAVRIEAPIPGTSYVGIEVPNEERETVFLKELMGDAQMQDNTKLLPLAIGKNIAGNYMFLDLQKMPHLLIAGATGSGKSILTTGFIVSLLMTKTPDEIKFIMVDPKQVELSDYNGIPHLLTPVITEMDKVLNALKWAINEMERRYTLFREARVRNIEGYNQMMGFSAFPYIVIVIDEMADMMMSTNKVETEGAIVRLAQKARATGIHLVLATQRPSVDVITGLIKANIPGRVGMSVTTQVDSRVILDHIGAESLLGRGDMLYKDPARQKAQRIQGMWVAPEEVQRVVKYIKDQVPEVHYSAEVVKKQSDPNSQTDQDGVELSEDNEFVNALRVIVSAQKGSASLLQRKLSIGYNRAARLLDELEEHGVVGPPNGSKPRDVMISDADMFLEQFKQKEEAN